MIPYWGYPPVCTYIARKGYCLYLILFFVFQSPSFNSIQFKNNFVINWDYINNESAKILITSGDGITAIFYTTPKDIQQTTSNDTNTRSAKLLFKIVIDG